MRRRGRRGSFESAFNKNKKKRRAFISFYFNIYINRSFFHPPYLISLFFLPLRSIFPVNISLFVCFCVFSSVSYIALRVTRCDGQDGRPSINSLCHTGNAGGGTGRGWRRLRRAVRGETGLWEGPHTGRSYCLVLEPGEEKKRVEKKRRKKLREMAIRPENVPRPLLLLQNKGSTSPFFPPAGPSHACMLLSASIQGTKRSTI